ncbi:MAG TPA: GNAT family N-acetyltransferase [Fodinibius sp.]|nr:GNAT family N-acetyltransferase [Fodinibius sp.]
MHNFPTLKTERLRLRGLQVSDIPDIVSLADNRKVADMTLSIPHPYQPKDAVAWINAAIEGFKDGSHFIFAICPLPGNDFIGGIGLEINKGFDRAELGFWIGEPYWNNGYRTEATAAILHFGFNELALNKIYASHFLGNPASGRVMQKNGMIKEGELVDHLKKGDRYLSLVQYRVTRAEFI